MLTIVIIHFINVAIYTNFRLKEGKEASLKKLKVNFLSIVPRPF